MRSAFSSMDAVFQSAPNLISWENQKMLRLRVQLVRFNPLPT